MGNTRLTMYVNVTSNLVNVLFNWLLINGVGPFPRLEIAGAAIATDIGLLVGLALCFVSLLPGKRHAHFLELTRKDSWKLDREALGAMTKVAKGAMVEQVCIRIGFFPLRAHRCRAGRLRLRGAQHRHAVFEPFLFLWRWHRHRPARRWSASRWARSGRTSPTCTARSPNATRWWRRFCWPRWSSPAAGRWWGLYIYSDTANDAYVRQLAMNAMVIVGIMQPFQTSAVVYSGAGDTRYVAMAMILTAVVMRPILSQLAIYVVGEVFGLAEMALLGAWSMATLDMITRMVLMHRRYVGGKWHAIQL